MIESEIKWVNGTKSGGGVLLSTTLMCGLRLRLSSKFDIASFFPSAEFLLVSSHNSFSIATMIASLADG